MVLVVQDLVFWLFAAAAPVCWSWMLAAPTAPTCSHDDSSEPLPFVVVVASVGLESACVQNRMQNLREYMCKTNSSCK